MDIQTQWVANYHQRLCFRLLWSWPLTFWPENLISMSPGADTCDLILVKLAPTVTKVLYSPAFLDLPDLWPQNLINMSMNPNTYVNKTGWNCPRWFLRYGHHNVFGMHKLTHGRTHLKTKCLRHQMFMLAEAQKQPVSRPYLQVLNKWGLVQQ